MLSRTMRATTGLVILVGLALAAVLPGFVLAGPTVPALVRLDVVPVDATGGSKVSAIPGDVVRIAVSGLLSDKTRRDLTASVPLTSSKPDLVVVTGTGLVRADRPGEAEITARDPASGLVSKTKVKIKVAKLKSITLEPRDKAVRLGRTIPLRALGTYENGRSEVDLTSVVVWRSEKPKIAELVREDGAGPGTFRGLARGVAKIVAEDPVSRVKSPSSDGKLAVLDELVSLTIEPATLALHPTETQQIRAIGIFRDGGRADVSNDATWESSDGSVATISSRGVVQGVAFGSAGVTARDSVSGIATESDGARVSVLGAMQALTVLPTAVTLEVGGTARLQGLAVFEGSSEPVALGRELRWKTSASGSVTVDAAGTVKCIAPGVARIAATDPASGIVSTTSAGDAVVSCVTDHVTVRVAPAKALLQVTESKTLRAYRTLPDGTESEIGSAGTWTSSDPSVVTIGNTDLDRGRAKAVKPGVATITVVDGVTGLTSDQSGGTSAVLSVAGRPKVVKIFPEPSSGGSLAGTVGVGFQLKARVDYEGGATQGINAAVGWSVANPSVAQISDGSDGNPAGWTTPLSAGTTRVTITYPKPGAPPPKNAPTTPLTASVDLVVSRPR